MMATISPGTALPEHGSRMGLRARVTGSSTCGAPAPPYAHAHKWSRLGSRRLQFHGKAETSAKCCAPVPRMHGCKDRSQGCKV